MSLPKPDVHVRLSEAAMRELRFLAEVNDIDASRMAARLLEAALLGAGHVAKHAAQRVLAAGIRRDQEG